MVAQFGDFDFDTRPTRTARYLVTARDARGRSARRLRRARDARASSDAGGRDPPGLDDRAVADGVRRRRRSSASWVRSTTCPTPEPCISRWRAAPQEGITAATDQRRRRDRRRSSSATIGSTSARSPTTVPSSGTSRRTPTCSRNFSRGHGGQRDRDRGAAVADAAGRRRHGRRRAACALPFLAHRRTAGPDRRRRCPSAGVCSSTSPPSDSGSW